MSNEIKEKEEYEKFARDHRKELDAQEVKLGDVVTVLVGHFAGEKGVIVGMIACDKSDYADPYYEIEMECDVPEEFRVRKTLIGQSRVIGGVERRYLKVIGSRAPKQPSMEIKQGDKVRVSKAIPNMYLVGFGYAVIGDECKAREIDEGNALIKWKDNYITIPIKYLVKVDAEAKEAKFKKGDKVKYVGKEHPEYWGEVFTVDGEMFYNSYHKNMQIDSIRCEKYNICNVPLSDLVLYTEPTEAEEDARIRQKKAELDEFRKAELDRVLHPEKYYTYEVTIDNVTMNWQRYAADLAKEVALKVANKYNDPKQAAEYAVKVAKAVAEGLKKK